MQKLDPKAVWLFFFGFLTPQIFLYVFVIMFIAVPVFIDTGFSNIGIFAFILLIVIVVGLLLGYVWSVFSYKYYLYGLLDDGFRKEHGVIYKKYVTIPYNRIQNVDIHRGILDRLLGLSKIKIQTAGGISVGSYGASAEGYLPGIDKNIAEEIRNELIKRARMDSNQNIGAI